MYDRFLTYNSGISNLPRIYFLIFLFYVLHICVLFGTFFCMSVVYLWLECFDVLCYFFTKYEHADQVRDCHERICYI